MTDPTTEGWPAVERRRAPRKNPVTLPRPLVLTICAAIFFAVMVPIGFILFFAERADERATKSQGAACTLLQVALSQEEVADRAVATVERQQLVLGRGLELAVGEDDEQSVQDLLDAVAEVERALEETEVAQTDAGDVITVARRFDLPCTADGPR